MTARERMIGALARAEGPICDDCVREPAGLSSRQQANQLGRALCVEGAIRRGQGSCSTCGKFKTVSVSCGGVLPEPPATSARTAGKPWHWEGHVQAVLVSHLEREGWQITRTANTATKEGGVDVKALDPSGCEWWFSVKGYPEGGPEKRTRPATQARHWFSHAMFDVVMYRTERDDVRLGVAVPGPYAIYEKLSVRSHWLQQAAPFTLFVVHQDGSLERRD
jgi:hypothetical protein